MYSNFYDKYQQARNLSWEILLKYKISSLPVDVLKLCSDIGIKVYSYETADKIIQALGLLDNVRDNDGISFIMNDKYIILYDSNIEPFARRRFTVCHELGHILLGHLAENSPSSRVTSWNRDEDEPDENESAANIFASRLLAPACVLKELNILTVDELIDLTGLSRTAAKYRLKRLNELKKRNKFYLHPLEQQVIKQFTDFINNYK